VYSQGLLGFSSDRFACICIFLDKIEREIKGDGDKKVARAIGSE
jgi:hypothetical protein